MKSFESRSKVSTDYEGFLDDYLTSRVNKHPVLRVRYHSTNSLHLLASSWGFGGNLLCTNTYTNFTDSLNVARLARLCYHQYIIEMNYNASNCYVKNFTRKVLIASFCLIHIINAHTIFQLFFFAFFQP